MAGLYLVLFSILLALLNTVNTVWAVVLVIVCLAGLGTYEHYSSRACKLRALLRVRAERVSQLEKRM